jgi:hypothetical protein
LHDVRLNGGRQPTSRSERARIESTAFGNQVDRHAGGVGRRAQIRLRFGRTAALENGERQAHGAAFGPSHRQQSSGSMELQKIYGRARDRIGLEKRQNRQRAVGRHVHLELATTVPGAMRSS